MNREETSSLQNQVQAICPGSLQQYGIDSFNAMCSEISKAIGLLTNKRNRDLIMMATSERYILQFKNNCPFRYLHNHRINPLEHG